jgi:hypothetical protein
MADRKLWSQKDREHEQRVQAFFDQCVREGRATPEEVADARRPPDVAGAGTGAMRRAQSG